MEERRTHLIRRMLGFVRPYFGRFAAGQVVMLLTTASGLVLPLLTRNLIDGLSGAAAAHFPVTSLLFFGGNILFFALARAAQEYLFQNLSQHISRDIRGKAFAKVQKLPLSHFDEQPSSTILSLVTNDLNVFQVAVTQGLMFILTQALSLVFIVVVLARMSLVMTLVAFASLPFMLISTLFFSRRQRSISREEQEQLSLVTRVFQETLRGIVTIKSFLLEPHATGIFRTENDRTFALGLRGLRVRVSNSLVTGIGMSLSVVALIGFGSWQVSRGLLGLGDLVAFLLYAQMLTGPVGSLSGITVEIQRAFAAAQRIFALLDAQEEADAPDSAPPVAAAGMVSSGPTPLPPGDDATPVLEIVGLTFRYSPEATDVLREVELRVNEGESCAFVGPSGAGKSTLFKLLLGFYADHSRSILLYGRPVAEYSLHELRSIVGIIPQESHLFDLSIRENILCGNPTASEEDLVRAAQAAAIHDFVASLPDGYDTVIGENGVRLSGGQRQRICIARTFLKNPPVLLLDEATSSLDGESERAVQIALERLRVGRTVLAIAHRLSTVRHMDRICVMDGGRIVAYGTHQNLLAASPLYEKLCRYQLLGGVSESRAG